MRTLPRRALNGHTPGKCVKLTGHRRNRGPVFRSWEWRFLERRLRTAFPTSLPDHTSPIFSRDGRRLFTIGKPGTPHQKTIGIWNVSSGELIRKLPTEFQLVSLSCSPDERLFAGGTVDGRQLVLDGESGRVLWKKDDYGNRFNAMSFSPDGQWLLSVNSDAGNLIQVVSSPSGKKEAEVTLKHEVQKLIFSEDGRWLGAAGTGKNNPPAIVDPTNWNVVTIFPNGNTKLAFHPNSKEIATGTNAGSISTWNWDGSELTQLHDWQAVHGKTWHTRQITALQYSRDGSRLLCGDRGSQVSVWDAATGEEIARLDANDIPWSAAFGSTDPGIVAFATQSSGIQFWRYSPSQNLSCKVMKEDAIARFSPDGKRVVASPEQSFGVGGPPTFVLASTAETIAAKENFEAVHNAIWMDGRHIAAGGDDSTDVRVFDAFTGEPSSNHQRRSETSGYQVVADLASFDGRLLAIYYDGVIASWDVGSAQSLQEFRIDDDSGPNRFLRGKGISHDLKFVATSYWSEYTIEIWDVASQQRAHKIPVPNQVPECIQFLHDNSRIFVGSSGGRLTQIDLATGQEQQRYVGHKHRLQAIALSPDERHLVSGDEAGKVYVWDVTTTQPILTLTNANQAIHTLDWSSDGQRIVAGKTNGTIHIWDVKNEEHPPSDGLSHFTSRGKQFE